MEQNNQSPVSQTGATDVPLQVESVQYNVNAKEYQSKPGLIFVIANTCMALGLFVLATLLFAITGSFFDFGPDNIGRMIQLGIAALIPASVIGYIALNRLKELVESHPEALEDIKFKSILRKSFLFFLTLSGLSSFVSIFNFIGIFIEIDDKTLQNTFFSIYYVGGLIIMTLWLYGYQKKTSR